MTLYMDVHTIAGGVSIADVADAHVEDPQIGAKYGEPSPLQPSTRGRSRRIALPRASAGSVAVEAPRTGMNTKHPYEDAGKEARCSVTDPPLPSTV